MTDTYAEAPAPELRERLDYALAHIGDAELATVIAAAGLAAVHDEWQRCRVDLAVQEDVARALALRIAQLTGEARRWKRRWAGAVAQARQEHAVAEQFEEAVTQLFDVRAALVELADQLEREHLQPGSGIVSLLDVAARIRQALDAATPRAECSE